VDVLLFKFDNGLLVHIIIKRLLPVLQSPGESLFDCIDGCSVIFKSFIVDTISLTRLLRGV